ncbi:LOB domain-containing protein 37 [Hibiscus syriacus]|uniref:LOB domain-containing protein 37 n=1 Tax=Hibiscus syriacus TaxID=106335 RepID=A0A6A2XNX9_HIBSY|nr:LOB domain-containing protein 37 [Hibiscus syriacus]
MVATSGKEKSRRKTYIVHMAKSEMPTSTWTEEEDSRLEAAIEEQGYCWSKIATCSQRIGARFHDQTPEHHPFHRHFPVAHPPQKLRPSQRPALFQSLLFEACGRTVNPLNGAVGIFMDRKLSCLPSDGGNCRVCQATVETVLRGRTLRAMPELMAPTPPSDETSGATVTYTLKLQETTMNLNSNYRFPWFQD